MVIKEKALELLFSSGAILSGSHIVYKAGTHGSGYINKEKFFEIGAINMEKVIFSAAENALENGLDFNGENSVGIIGPAMGAIGYSLTMAIALEKLSGRAKFFPARTELVTDSTGKKIHVIPEKLAQGYKNIFFVIFEDVVNNGTTIREVKTLFSPIARVGAAICLADRGGQSANSLGIAQYYPFSRVDMTQYDAFGCPLCKKGISINTVLGKGERWVKLFGQPPYEPSMDFSKFWE